MLRAEDAIPALRFLNTPLRRLEAMQVPHALTPAHMSQLSVGSSWAGPCMCSRVQWLGDSQFQRGWGSYDGTFECRVGTPLLVDTWLVSLHDGLCYSFCKAVRDDEMSQTLAFTRCSFFNLQRSPNWTAGQGKQISSGARCAPRAVVFSISANHLGIFVATITADLAECGPRRRIMRQEFV